MTGLTKGDRVLIKEGAPVGQDFQTFSWENPEVVFEFVDYVNRNKARVRLRAYGYGMLDGGNKAYGCGEVYTKPDCLIKLDNQPDRPTDTERFDWLENRTWNARQDLGVIDGKQYYRINFLKNAETYDWGIAVFPTMREAVDAAMDEAP